MRFGADREERKAMKRKRSGPEQIIQKLG